MRLMTDLGPVRGSCGPTVPFCTSRWQFIKHQSSWASVHFDSKARDSKAGRGMNLDIWLLGIVVKVSPTVQVKLSLQLLAPAGSARLCLGRGEPFKRRLLHPVLKSTAALLSIFPAHPPS